MLFNSLVLALGVAVGKIVVLDPLGVRHCLFPLPVRMLASG